MKLIDLYRFVVKKGMEKDPRSASELRDDLASTKKEYRLLKGVDKKAFDREMLTNPYADTRILYGDPETVVRKILVGIDMEVGEIVAADRLNEKGADRKSVV